VEKEVNPAFQSNSFEPIAIDLGFGIYFEPIAIGFGF